MSKSALLPEFCYGTLPTTGEVILIKLFEKGYYPCYNGKVKGEDKARELNARLGVTPAQQAAMEAGSMFGWSCPAADPNTYDEEGKPKKRDG
jgi:hypothetical protein